MMFQHELQPPPIDALDGSSSNGHSSTSLGATLAAPVTLQGSADGLSRANSLARTRAIATLRRAASARELKRAASQKRQEANRGTPSPVPPSDNAENPHLLAAALTAAAAAAATAVSSAPTMAPTTDSAAELAPALEDAASAHAISDSPAPILTPVPNMASQFARTYAMAKLLGAAGTVSPEVVQDTLVTAPPEPPEADQAIVQHTAVTAPPDPAEVDQAIVETQSVPPTESDLYIEEDPALITFQPDEDIQPEEDELPAAEEPIRLSRSPTPDAGPSGIVDDVVILQEEDDEERLVEPRKAPSQEEAPAEVDTSVTLQPETDEPLTSVNSLDSPGLLLSATVNQIHGPSDFEEKFLLLFSDTLVIAKPLAPPEGMEGAPRLRAESFMEKPDLDWSFSVERVVHLHRVGLIVHRDKVPVSKSHALMPSFVRHFSSNPEGAIDQLISLTGLNKDARTIAKLLFQTPELDPQQLCDYICAPARQEILDAFIAQHAVTGVSIESGLRSLLLGIRFPNDRLSFKSLLISFSRHWVASNRSLIKPAFSSGLAANLIFYIMALNDALHATEASRQMFSAPRPNYTEADFLQEFRKLDAFGVLSDRTLGRIFASVRAEPIQQALPLQAGPRLSVRVENGLPSKLSPHIPSEPITVVIDRPDPDFAVRVYGKDLIFDPPVLSFTHTNRCSFTITPRSLDAKSITFVKIGRRAPYYVANPPPDSSSESALPKSFNVLIEPPELRHTFTLTIAQGDAVKHKVTFSAENAHRRRVITNALKERIDICISKKRSQSREQAAREAAEAAANGVHEGVSLKSISGKRREPSPIPPLDSFGAETFSFCEPATSSFLRRVYNHCQAFTSPSSLPLASPLLAQSGSHEGLKPHVTLTFAQSLDAKIAGIGGKQLILSGEESMLMTHSLRTLHDGILVGVGTAVNDNPQLNARLLSFAPPVDRLPRPIVLDTQLRTSPTCKLLLNYQNGTGRQPLLVCARTASGVRAAELERAGAELVVASCEFDGLLSWRAVLAALARKGVTRLMVEGGATVISGLLDSPFVDTLIVTVAPKLIGPQGVSHNATLPLAGPGATGERGASETFNLVTSRQFGRDVVFAWRRKETVPPEMKHGASHNGNGGVYEPHSRSPGEGVQPNPYLEAGELQPSRSALAPVPGQALAPIPAPSPTPAPTAASQGSGGLLGRLASLRRGNSTAKRQAAALANGQGSNGNSRAQTKGSRDNPPFHLF